MATCKDCVHVEACKNLYEIHGDGLSSDSHACKYFKERSRFVELPCKVGDILYFNNVHIKYARVIALYIDASGGMFDLMIYTNQETVSGYENFINKDYTFEDIGKQLFLTREAAEQALKNPPEISAAQGE